MSDEQQNETLVVTADEVITTPDEGGRPAEAVITDEDGVGRISVTGSVADAGSPTDDTALSMPEKFANAENPQEALLQAYNEMVQKMSGGEPKEAVEATPAPEGETEGDRTKAEAVKGYSEMWAKNQSLTDDQWQQAGTELGLDVADLRSYEAYQKSQLEAKADGVTSHDEGIYKAAGGQDEYNKMIDWANTKMSDSQIDALNSQLDNPEFSAMGINMLKTMYVSDVGQEASKGTLDGANVPSNNLSDQFHSEAEWMEAQKHPQYGKGGAYDKQFDSKLARFMKATGQL